MTETHQTELSFSELDLPEPLMRAVAEAGYEQPSPIQAGAIPHLLQGRDLLGQAQTGTGKTAAFALPLLAAIDPQQHGVQALVLVPTRELALQVSEALNSYGRHMPRIEMLAIYGGQDYGRQLRALKNGVQVVIGTPGRVMDHLRRGTLRLDNLRTVVLDEADEMLRMGFIDDVQWILEQTPEARQMVLFSATMPAQVRRMADRFLRDPEVVSIRQQTRTATNIRQRYLLTDQRGKSEALARILESEEGEAMIVFARTKAATVEISDRLRALGHASAALNGDVPQNQRERIVAQLKDGRLDIVVATDVAARGLDVERITHVINYDMPGDNESFVHRIGRTGRAGRDGDAILFVTHRERRILSGIERSTRQKMEEMRLPGVAEINARRVERFKQRITEALAAGDVDFYRGLIRDWLAEHSEASAVDAAAALAVMLQGKAPFLMQERREPQRKERREKVVKAGKRRENRDAARASRGPLPDMEQYRIEVGRTHQVKPGHIVGAIANEAGLEGRYIGRITINDDHSLVDLPEGMPKEIFNELKRVRVAGRPLRISRA
ncbi:MAG: DEAD/DEAH box helicase [Gammaproteobacteria bacterium]|nr:MAG: DEAD/DEAH box helicase [Gammaproteobacteria bacterium]